MKLLIMQFYIYLYFNVNCNSILIELKYFKANGNIK
jgi:hypothetical protein